MPTTASTTVAKAFSILGLFEEHAVLTSSVDPKTARRIGFEMTPAIAARTRASVGGTCLAAMGRGYEW